MGGCQIQHWLHTGEFLLRADDDNSTKGPSPTTIDDYDAYHQDPESVTSASSTVPSVLVGADDDPLLPTRADIERVYYSGQATWRSFVDEAEALPRHGFPAVFGDPYLLLADVPALPPKLPKVRVLTGQPLWHVPDVEPPPSTVQPPLQQTDTNHVHGVTRDPPSLDMQYRYGVRKHLRIAVPRPVELRTSPTSSRPPCATPLTSPASGLLILTLGWSYILSVQLLEMQGRAVSYHDAHVLRPQTAASAARCHREGFVVLDLSGDALSAELVRWICAILAPKAAWGPVDGRDGPPWAAHCPTELRFAVVSDDAEREADGKPPPPPPRAAAATELLIEFCSLFGLGLSETEQAHRILPPTAAFLAALMLPFTSVSGLQPQFAIPKLRRRRAGKNSYGRGLLASRLRQYTADARYFMTLSLDQYGIGSILWSVFWQPNIPCNLVSAWFGATIAVLGPILASRDLPKLVRVFATRRPRAAMWWLGLSMLGDLAVLDWIPRYMDELYERQGYGTLNEPDPTAAVWTSTPHSYLDDPHQRAYPDAAEPVALYDLLRHRYNFRLQETVYLAWRPFGSVPRAAIEPELWPWLERGLPRRYVTWVWWLQSKAGMVCYPQAGFRTDTGRCKPNVPDRLELATRTKGEDDMPQLKLHASRTMTAWMLSRSKEHVGGDTDMTVVDVNKHKWLRGYYGF
ncbi:hypothetical protein SPI_03136 [Niveomyces insectorum RCEF 264]|uniref:Uncharacterized protein n=1 Tax=Niveomyces insectorum RCEF 264 TaxID=1081102 RepID=A0A167X3P2_9HYPO|nr:hypothetical protein SPI_03136 [Niveomyces insectorum RCEF 264]